MAISKNPGISFEPGGFACYGGNRDAFFCTDPTYVLAGPAETGKTISSLFKLHIISKIFDNARIMMLRKTYNSLIESAAQTYMNKVVRDGEVEIYGGRKRPEQFIYPNGSRIVLGGMDNPNKILSSEWDIVYIPQIEELILPEFEIITTRTTGRAGNIPNPQTFGDANPAPSTHWIKQLSTSGKLTFFNTTHRDNPSLYDPITGEITEQGKRSLASLNRLTGARKQRLLYGLWVQEEGAIYDVFTEDRHKVKSFQPHPLWVRVVGIDPKGAFTAAVWLAYDSENHILNCYREYYQPFGLSLRDHATNIKTMTGNEPVMMWCTGAPGERQERRDFQEFGIPAIPPPFGDVWSGIDRVYELLKYDMLVIHDCCTNLLSEIGSYKRKTVNGIVTNDIEGKETYHLLDALRYAVAAITGNQTMTQLVYDVPTIGNY